MKMNESVPNPAEPEPNKKLNANYEWFMKSLPIIH